MTRNSKEYSPGGIYAVIVIVLAALIGLDQWTKHLAAAKLLNSPAKVLIHGVLELTYLENNGAAFSMLQGKQIFFRILTVVFLAAAIWFLIRIPKRRYYLPMICSVSLLIAGAAGNFIDRISNGYVVDFIYFSIINFPVFNVADIYVTVGIVLLIILLLFYYKEQDFRFSDRGSKNAE